MKEYTHIIFKLGERYFLEKIKSVDETGKINGREEIKMITRKEFLRLNALNYTDYQTELLKCIFYDKKLSKRKEIERYFKRYKTEQK